ncbi:hypothetical protein ACI4CU_27315, partial [Klebsiella pneumoniae]|uniref:hypothetical protein n=1 Tax=Klebsiella pneumoniae TaxID=573 RepID=UPI0038548DC4
SYELNYTQPVTESERLAGEGAEHNTFMVGLAGIKSTMVSPLYFPVTGWAHPVFAQLWDAAKMALWGVGTSSIALTTQGVVTGATSLTINNIIEFMDFATPFTLEIVG